LFKPFSKGRGLGIAATGVKGATGAKTGGN